MDPYQPPSAALPEPPITDPKRFRIVPVLVGGLVVDFIGSNFVGLLAGMCVGIIVAAKGGPREGVRALAASPVFLGVTTALGSALSILGGYVAARWAGTRFLLHAGAAGAIPLAITLLLIAFRFGDGATLPTYVGFAVQIPLALAGGWLAARRAAQ